MDDFRVLYEERTRMYDEVVEQVGAAKERIAELEAEKAELRRVMRSTAGKLANLLRRWGTDAGATVTAMKRHVVALADAARKEETDE